MDRLWKSKLKTRIGITMVLIACISVSIRTSLHASSDSLSEYIRNTQKRAGIQSAAVVACIDGNVEYLQCEDDTALPDWEYCILSRRENFL